MNSQPQTIFRAVADPTRRAIIDLLAGQELTANEVAAEFSISRPAISRHLRILKEGALLWSVLTGADDITGLMLPISK